MKKKHLWSIGILASLILIATLIGPTILLNAVRQPEVAERYAYSESFYESYDEMLEKAKLDVVIVETGADIHAEFCTKALNKNINVLSDIPVVASLTEAEEL